MNRSRTRWALVLIALGGCQAGDEPASDPDLQAAPPVASSQPIPLNPDGTEQIHEAFAIDKTGAQLSYNRTANGPIMSGGVDVYLLYYGNWSSAASKSVQSGLKQFVQDVGNTKWWNIAAMYSDARHFAVSPAVNFKVATNVPYLQTATSPPTNVTALKDADVATIVSNYVASTGTPANTFAFYYVVLGTDVSETSKKADGTPSNYCVAGGFCAWHTFAQITGSSIAYGVGLDPTGRCPTAGAMCAPVGTPVSPTGAPITVSGNTALDTVIANFAHELSEAATDPQINAWIKSGNEIADLCNLKTPSNRQTVASGAPYNLTVGTRKYYLPDLLAPVGNGVCMNRVSENSDLTWTNYTANQMAVWQFTGPSTVKTPPAFTIDQNAYAPLGWGDLTGDGNDDLYMFRLSDDAIVVQPMRGGATNGKQIVVSPVPASNLFPATVGDFDGDGIADVAFTTTSGTAGLVVWQLNSNGTLKVSPPAPVIPVSSVAALRATGDVDGDRKADVVWHVDGDVYLLWTMNGGTTTHQIAFNAPEPVDVVLGDVLGLGRKAVIVRSADSVKFFNVALGPTPTFLPGVQIAGAPGSDWQLIGSGDVNGDGRSDLVWTNFTSSLVSSWVISPKDNTWSFPTAINAGGQDWAPIMLATDVSY